MPGEKSGRSIPAADEMAKELKAYLENSDDEV